MMKNGMLQLALYSLFCLALFTSCEKEEKDDFEYIVDLDKDSATINVRGGEEIVQFTSNGKWEIEEVPDWLTVTPISGDESADIRIQAKESRELKKREFELVFIAGPEKRSISISQPGLKDIIWGPTLPISDFRKMHHYFAPESYEIETYNLFINPGIKDRIFLGNLISHNATPHTDIPEFTGYTFNQFKVVPSISYLPSIPYTPSRQEQDAIVQQIITNLPSQSDEFIAFTGTVEFYDYKRLHTLGMVNLGIKLDELVSGISYTEKEMSRKYGMIYSYKHTVFSLMADNPIRDLIQEELKESDVEKGVSFVSTIRYGKVGLLIVESDTDSQDVELAINKVIKEESLSQQETVLIENADISYIYFTNDGKIQVKKGTLDAVHAYVNGVIKEKENIYPITFELENYISGGMGLFNFSFTLPTLL